MIVWTVVKVALKSLWASKLRSALAMLGIIIGVWAVIAVLSLVEGTRQTIVDRISALGTNLLLIGPGQRGSGGVVSGIWENLKLPDAEALLKGVPEIHQVAPVVRGNVQVKYFNHNTRSTALGTSGTYFHIRDFEIDQGRALTDADADGLARVAVIGPVTAEHLFGGQVAIGQFVKLNGINFRVVGVLKAKGDQGWFNPDDQIIIPYTVAMKQIMGLDYLQEIDIDADDPAHLDIIQTKATALLRRRHRLGAADPSDFDVFNQADVMKTFATVNTVMTLLLGGTAAISLLVGGFGIMNIMLVTVTERTREIGVRKAIGAKDRDILGQFLLEAVVMSGIGGLIGLGLGLATVWGVTAASPYKLAVQPLSVVVGIGFSGAVGTFFGLYPAWRASRLDPIEALRYE
jgi:putative ABC transport system permease protein